MYRITFLVSDPLKDPQGMKEAISYDLEKYGNAECVSVEVVDGQMEI